MLFFSAGAVLIPSCLQQDKASLALSNLTLTGSQEKMMASLAAAIIPTSNDFMGAAEVKAHEFTLMMVDDCEAPEAQEKYMDGMNQFNKLVQDQFKKDFTDLSAEQKQELLIKLEKNADVPEPVLHFYKMTKRYTVQAFTSSEKYMTQVRKFKLVPGGNFKGCVPAAKS